MPVLKDEQTISFPILRADLEYWLEEWTPVILIVYDAQEEIAYWCYIQAHFQQQTEFNLRMVGESVNIPIDKACIVSPEAVRQFARFKANIQQQFGGINHEIV